MKKESPNETIDHKVLIYPAMTPDIDGKRIYFLFSLYQVEDITGELTVYDVPFSAPCIEGITAWRGGAIPVVSLERYVGMSVSKSAQTGSQRFIVIRSARQSQKGSEEMRSAFRTEREIKMTPIPDSTEPARLNGWVHHNRVKGVFEWEQGFMVIPEMDPLFYGDIHSRIQ